MKQEFGSPQLQFLHITAHKYTAFCSMKRSKYNKSLKDPVRGAGSAQVQIRSYRNRQSGNLARKVSNAFPMCKALKQYLEDCTIFSNGRLLV